MPGKKGSKHGTASMSLEKRIEVSRAGGLAAFKKGTGIFTSEVAKRAHRWNSISASIAGLKSGVIRRGNKGEKS